MPSRTNPRITGSLALLLASTALSAVPAMAQDVGTAAAVPTSWAIAGTAESAVLASSKARLPVIRGFVRDGITHLKNEPLCPL